MRVYKILSFSVVILLITVLFVGAVTVPAAAQTDAMQFHYNAQHTGDYSVVAGTEPPNNLLKWNFTTGGPVTSSPAVANGVVYIGSSDGNIYALNANTGAKLWNYTTGGGVSSSPAVVNGVVYVGSEDGNVYAVGTESAPITTTLTVNAPASIFINQNFIINGTLSASAGGTTAAKVQRLVGGSTPISGATIQLQQSTDNGATWTNVAGKTAITDANGNYFITMSVSAPGQYWFRTAFAGGAIGGTTYAASTSIGSVTVQVSPSPTPTVTPTVSPSVTPTVKPSSVTPTFRREVPCVAVVCVEVCDAHTLPSACEAPTATPSPTSSFALPPNITPPPIPGVPEFPIAGVGAGVVFCALAAAYLMLRRD